MFECVDCLQEFCLDEGEMLGANFFRCNPCIVAIEIDIAAAKGMDGSDEEHQPGEPFSTSRFLQESLQDYDESNALDLYEEHARWNLDRAGNIETWSEA
jgi:hypothetical protein